LCGIYDEASYTRGHNYFGRKLLFGKKKYVVKNNSCDLNARGQNCKAFRSNRKTS
jgi:hypothetical protein